MEGIADYDILYSEQDVVLNTLKEIDTGFYLTGGTCIHRFYLDYRYSDDLDFFCNDNDLFRDYAREYFEFLKSKQLYFEYLVDTRDFIRILFNKKLKIDFVNDRVFRYNKIERSKEGYKIDNIFNILANKITAVISRDEPKDVFDICSISNPLIEYCPFVSFLKEFNIALANVFVGKGRFDCKSPIALIVFKILAAITSPFLSLASLKSRGGLNIISFLKTNFFTSSSNCPFIRA